MSALVKNHFLYSYFLPIDHEESTVDSLTIEALEGIVDKSTLDKSQQEALVSSLRSPLAIIQGPPGCGKTFIGTTLVKILLSLQPQPQLPILLLTYKNHALDEFLKDALSFLSPTDIARIGGRSKEEKLAACNLKELKKNGQKSKVSQRELYEIYEEKDELTKEVSLLLQKMSKSSVLTFLDVLEALDEDQLITLFEGAPYSKKVENGKITKKINNKKNIFANQMIVRDTIKSIKVKYKGLKEFLRNNDGSDDFEKAIASLFQMVVLNWMPSLEKIRDLKSLQDQYVNDIKEANENMEKDCHDDSDDEELDEEAVEAIQEQRMAAMGKNSDNTKRKKPNLEFFKEPESKDVVLQLKDLPSNLEPTEAYNNQPNLWSLNDVQRIRYLFTLLHRKFSDISGDLHPMLKRLDELFEKEAELQSQQEADLLASR